jgi:hypothetical protein
VNEYLLQEDGFQLVLEDGSGSIILEAVPDLLKIDQMAVVSPSRWLAAVLPSSWIATPERS